MAPARSRRAARSRPRSLSPKATLSRTRHVREQAVGLEDHAHVPLVGRHPGEVLAADATRAGRRPAPARPGCAARWSCRSRRAEQRDQLARRDVQVEPVQGAAPRRRRGVRSSSSTATPAGGRTRSSRHVRHVRLPSPVRRRGRGTTGQQQERTASTREARAAAIDVGRSLLPIRPIATGSVSQCSSEAKVNSPSTRATVMKRADEHAGRRCSGSDHPHDHGDPAGAQRARGLGQRASRRSRTAPRRSRGRRRAAPGRRRRRSA